MYVKYKEMRKKKYVTPSNTIITVESVLMNTYSGDHVPGSNNGQVGDAKENDFFFEDDDEEEK
jgi:hypothetical protein